MRGWLGGSVIFAAEWAGRAYGGWMGLGGGVHIDEEAWVHWTRKSIEPWRYGLHGHPAKCMIGQGMKRRS